MKVLRLVNCLEYIDKLILNQYYRVYRKFTIPIKLNDSNKLGGCL